MLFTIYVFVMFTNIDNDSVKTYLTRYNFTNANERNTYEKIFNGKYMNDDYVLRINTLRN